MQADLIYTKTEQFACFRANTEKGKEAWDRMHATKGAAYGAVSHANLDSLLEQLNDADYTVIKEEAS